MAGISIRIGGDLREFRKVVREMRLTMRELGRAFSPVTRTARAAFQGVYAAGRGSFRALSSLAHRTVAGIRSAFGSLKGLLTGGGPLGAALRVAGVAGGLALITSQIGAATRMAGGLEQTQMALTALTGSAQTAGQVLADMRATWSATGVTVEDQARTIQKFIALGFSADDAVQLQKNILDVAGGIGMTAEEASLLGSALAQVKAKGVVSMEELRQQIAEKGVPVFEALAAKLGVSQAELMKLVEDGQVPAQALLDIFQNMEGVFGKFAGGATRMGSTFLGTIARLRAAWGQLLVDFTRPILDAIRPVLDGAISRLDGLREKAAQVGAAVRDIFLGAFVLIRDGRTMELLGAGFRIAVMGAIDLLMRGLRGAVAFLATALPPVFESLMAKFQDPQFWMGIGEIFNSLGYTLTANIKEALGQFEEAKVYRNAAETDMRMGGIRIGRAGGGDDLATTLSDALAAGLEAAAAAAAGPSSPGIRAALQGFRELLRGVNEEVQRMRPTGAAAPASGAPAATAAEATGPLAGLVQSIGRAFTIGGSLARVGGGSFGVQITPMVSQQQRTNNQLARIEKNTRPAAGPRIVQVGFA